MSESVFDRPIITLQGIILLSLRSVTCGESRLTYTDKFKTKGKERYRQTGSEER